MLKNQKQAKIKNMFHNRPVQKIFNLKTHIYTIYINVMKKDYNRLNYILATPLHGEF